MFTVGYITYISDLKLEDHFPWLEKFFPERYETLKKGLTEGFAVPGFPAGFKLYEKEALIGIVLSFVSSTKDILASHEILQDCRIRYIT